MNKQKLKEEIQDALDTAKRADITATDENVSCIDADTFKRIAQPLRRALRFIEGKRTRAEQDADLLFDALEKNKKGRAPHEIAALLDDSLCACCTILNHKEIFRQLFVAEQERVYKEEPRLKAVLRDLKKGVPASTIARQLQEGTFNTRRQKGART